MPPATNPVQDNAAIMEAIRSLKTEISTEIDSKFTAQSTAFEDRFKAVDSISQTLEQAKNAQIEAQKRAQQGSQPAWVPKDWSEIPAMIDQRASEIAKRALDARDKAEQDRNATSSREEQELEAQIDRQLADLERVGYLPTVGNPNDYNDPGVASRRELLAAASHMGTPELDKVAMTLTELHKRDLIFNATTKTYDDATGTLAPLPGKFAPVGNSSSHAPSGNSGPSYREIHAAKDFDSLIALAAQRGYGPVPTSSDRDTGY